MRSLRTDRWGFSASTLASALIGVLVVVILGLVLSPVVTDQVDAMNDTGTSQDTLVDLIPVFWFLGLAIVAAAIVFIALRQAL